MGHLFPSFALAAYQAPVSRWLKRYRMSAPRPDVLARSAGFTLRHYPASHILKCKRAMSNSVEVAPLLATREDRLPSNSPRWQAVALLLLVAWLYASIIAHLFLQWVGPHSDPNFQHGIFVPIFALFVLWPDRKKLKAIPSDPSWAGLPLVLLSLLMLVLGVLGAELFFSRVSLLILLA